MNIAIIQARMGSKRFPGKMLERLGDYSLIEWVIKRLKKSKKLDNIILATSIENKDDVFEQISYINGLNIFRGDENDVLGRFYECAKLYPSKNIIRVCADNPFIDPFEIDRLINKFEQNQYKYLCNHKNINNNNYADGFGAEIFTKELLKYLNINAKSKSQREHVTLFVWENQKLIMPQVLLAPKNLAFPQLRFDVDVKDDLKKLKLLIDRGVVINSDASQIIKIALKRK